MPGGMICRIAWLTAVTCDMAAPMLAPGWK